MKTNFNVGDLLCTTNGSLAYIASTEYNMFKINFFSLSTGSPAYPYTKSDLENYVFIYNWKHYPIIPENR
jgi:hypothetical protein